MSDPVPAAAPEARIDAATAGAVAAEASAAEIADAVENRQIAAAERRAEAAEETAEQIALAALHTELGRQVETLSQRLTSWQNEHDQTHSLLNAEIAGLKTETAAILDKLTAMQSLPIAAIPVSSSSPAALSQKQTPAAIVVPTESGAAMPAESAAPVQRPRIRLI